MVFRITPVYTYTENEAIVLMPIMLPSNKCLLLALIRRAWIIDFSLMGSDSVESLGTEAIDASSLVNNYG